jgi:poly-gamma-glutamate capsule biosynthesis protein CapA/YwtB (metallophosphatase superfamily)
MKLFFFFIFAIFFIVSNGIAQINDTVKTDSSILKTLSIIGVGDMMLGTNFPAEWYLPANKDCYPLMADIKDILLEADLAVGNLEGCFSDTAPLVKRCKDSTKCYAFRMPEHFAGCFKDAGFDVLTIANNHSGDFGDLGRNTTVKLLDSLGIHHAGWIKYPTAIFTKDSITYGIAAFAPNKGTVSIYDTISAKGTIMALKEKCDIVITTFHGGAEGNKHQHVTRKTETFYGENRGNVYEFSHALINAGADIAFGHGPHVPRAIEVYQNRFIAYSLGNFCTYGRFNLSGPNGLAPIAKIEINMQGEFVAGKIISAKQPKKGGTVIDADH